MKAGRYTPYQDRIASGQIVIADIEARLGQASYISSTLGPSLTLKLEVDGDMVVGETLQASSILNDQDYSYYKEFEVTPVSKNPAFTGGCYKRHILRILRWNGYNIRR